MAFTKDVHIEHTLEKSIELQAKREAEMATLGLEKLELITKNTTERGCATSSTIWKKVLAKYVEHIVEEAKVAFKPHKVLMNSADSKYLNRLTPETISITAMDIALNRLAVCKEAPKDSISNLIRSDFLNLLRHDILKNGKDKAYRSIQVAAKADSTLVDTRLKSLHDNSDLEGITTKDLEFISKISILAVTILVNSQLLNQTLKRWTRGKHAKHILSIDPRFLQMLSDDSLMDMTAFNVPKPMLLEPKDWSQEEDGGYITDYPRPIILISNTARTSSKQIQRRCSDEFFIGINSAQRTAFRVNLSVCALIDAAEGSKNVPNLIPDMDDPPRPEYTTDELHNKDGDDAKGKRMLMRLWHKSTAQMAQKRLAYFRTLKDIKENIQHGRFFFPHKLDFRGRMYPVAGGMSPQGSSLSKNCLEFADGQPWGEHGERHTAIALADAAGEKGTEDELAAWSYKNIDMINAIMEDMINNLSVFNSFDSPYAFVAIASEFLIGTRAKNPTEYISHVPIYKDGSVNGLQHIFAIMRDDIGGKHVNLNSGKTKGDAYTVVAEQFEQDLVGYKDTLSDDYRDIIRSNLLDKVLDMGLTRKDVKGIVMTIPYGSTAQGNVDTLTEQFIGRWEELGWNYRDKLGISYYALTKTMRPLIDVLGDVTRSKLPSAEVFQDYMRDCSLVANQGNTGLIWETATGFTVHCNKKANARESKVLRVKYKRLDHYISIKGKTDQIDKRKQTSGIVANFIHSIDAACLMLTVARLRIHHDMTSFALVHDAYGVHAGNCEIMQEVIRDVFVEVHEDNPLATFKANVEEISGFDLPDLPPSGLLDLNEVRKSTYFFS